MTGEKVNNDFRILILAPVGKDARLIFGTLRSEGFQSQICSDVANLISEIKAGVGAVLLTEEILLLPESSCLSDLMSTQASWSDIPILAFYGKRDGLLPTKTRYLTRFQKVTNVTFLERPISKATLISATKAAVRDRTRQYTVKELVNQLQQEKEKAETASKAKSQFLANMSHEIRTPLGAILGFAELAMDPLQPEKEHLESLRTIVRNSEQLSVLINDILDLSKVEAGHMLVEKVSFSLFELIQEVDKLLSVRAKRKGIALGFYFDSALPVNIVSDPTRLRQILINLIGNAIKFTDKGSVLVSISFESSQNNDAAGILSFKVKDTGIGISPEHRKLLFKPFVQGTVSVTRSFGGTGLGLVLSRRLAEALGGKLDIIDSKVREGTTLEFSAAVEVPAEAEFSLDLTNFEKEKSHPKTKPSELLLSGISVLVVDDAADNRVLLSRILSKNGVSVGLANDGVEGVEKAMTENYDIVLMDIQMPRKDGFEATRELRQKGFNRPIIALTAFAMKEDHQKSLQAGCSDYLSKPIQRDKLINMLVHYADESSMEEVLSRIESVRDTENQPERLH